MVVTLKSSRMLVRGLFRMYSPGASPQEVCIYFCICGRRAPEGVRRETFSSVRVMVALQARAVSSTFGYPVTGGWAAAGDTSCVVWIRSMLFPFFSGLPIFFVFIIYLGTHLTFFILTLLLPVSCRLVFANSPSIGTWGPSKFFLPQRVGTRIPRCL